MVRTPIGKKLDATRDSDQQVKFRSGRAIRSGDSRLRANLAGTLSPIYQSAALRLVDTVPNRGILALSVVIVTVVIASTGRRRIAAKLIARY